MQKSSPRTPLSKTLKHLIAGAKHLITSASVTPATQNRTAASRCLPRGTVSPRYRRAKPHLSMPAFSSLHRRSPETSPCRGDHWSPANMAPPCGRRHVRNENRATIGRPRSPPAHRHTPNISALVGATIGRPQIRLRLVVAAPKETKNGRPMVAPTPVERKHPASPAVSLKSCRFFLTNPDFPRTIEKVAPKGKTRRNTTKRWRLLLDCKGGVRRTRVKMICGGT